jgi:hypothetical protein
MAEGLARLGRLDTEFSHLASKSADDVTDRNSRHCGSKPASTQLVLANPDQRVKVIGAAN